MQPSERAQISNLQIRGLQGEECRGVFAEGCAFSWPNQAVQGWKKDASIPRHPSCPASATLLLPGTSTQP